MRGVGEVLSIVFRVHNAGERSVTNRGSEGFAKGFRDGEGSRACGGRSGRTVGKAREDPREGGGNDGGKDVRHLASNSFIAFFASTVTNDRLHNHHFTIVTSTFDP